MNIGQAAAFSGLAAKTVRYYEEIGLVKPARCATNDYRDYSEEDVTHLRFLQRARAVGFSLDVCGELLELYRNPERRCSQVKALLLGKVEQIELQLQELTEFKLTLSALANNCAGDETADSLVAAPPVRPAQPLMSFTLVEPQ